MATLDTLTVRFEADAEALFRGIDTLETRLASLKTEHTLPGGGLLDIQTRLTVTADEAIARALSGAGQTLSDAVRREDAALARSLDSAQGALCDALRGAVSQLASSINITVPVSIDGYQLGQAAVRGIRRVSLSQGMHMAY